MALFGRNNRKRASKLSRAGIVAVVVFASMIMGVGGYRILASRDNTALALVPPSKEKPPILIREGQRITVPEGSSLQTKLTVEAVAQQEIQRTLVLPAVVEADPARLAKILPPLAGRISQLRVQLGQRVDLGQPLAVLDSSDLGTAYADHTRAKVLLENATRVRDRQRALVKAGGAAEKDLQQADTDFATAFAEYQRADARLKQIGANPDTTGKSRELTVASPISGSVIDLTAAAGTYWNDATAPLMTIADLSAVWVTANLPEKDTAFVAKGQAVDIVFPAYPGEISKGKVLFISDVLDPDIGRTKVRIAFHNPDIRAKPGMFANVTFHAPPQTVPVIPTTAIVFNNDADQVYVEVAPAVFEPRQVETAFEQSGEAVVENGLKPGDRIVVKGGVLLND